MRKFGFTVTGFFVLLVLSCKLESKEPFIIDKQIDLYYQDSQGNDLLNPEVPGSFSADSIHYFDYIDGVKREIANRIDYPNGFVVFKNEYNQKYGIRIFPEHEVTLLELDRQIVDTIKCTFEKTDHTFIILQVLYNGNLEWNDYATLREFTVIK